MMTPDVPADVQSRISAFEALATSSTNVKATKSAPNLLDKPDSSSSKGYFSVVPSPPSTSTNFSSRSSSTSPPHALGRKTSLIDLKDWVVEDGPLPYAPRQKKVPGPTLESTLQRHVSDPTSVHGHFQTTPLIHLESSPPRTIRAAPPLPPRKTSYSSLKSVSVSNSSSSSLSHNGPSYPPLPSGARKKSDSLTVDSAYPPASKLGISIPSRGGNGSGHVPASSISSFHSVSLSSDGGTDGTTPGSLANFVTTYPIDHEDHDADSVSTRDIDTGSLDESFENVSASSMISPTTSSMSHDWAEYVRRPTEPPKLPQRPQAGSSTPSPSTTTPSVSVPYAVRSNSKGPPPPPPPRNRIPSSNRSSLASTTASSSDHSSVFSTSTSRSSLSSGRPVPAYPPKSAISSAQLPQLTRSPPIPPAPRRRYEMVFNKNVIAQRAASREKERATSPPFGRKSRQAAGWRGLSVDLITNPETAPLKSVMLEPVEEGNVTGEDRLEGRVVAKIWRLSKLEKGKLRSIWKECDTTGRGSLDREAFVKGMWRIDEELRKAQTNARSQATVRPPKGLPSILR